ncbi:butyrophilin subfamily 1 member A1-like isoform X2 [Epinephelus fuscoguttatus]|uniref:butyrophilin subfamily 1 member A1-like isoform X2 n=1 Tax=Epinephelus fuscoguttatus TaxID=293821 RepID=UPI0020D04678|nr:butyrophilin subfamily 1 member A1-like isoform X2 [Epinephelus fuscoguttatus]
MVQSGRMPTANVESCQQAGSNPARGQSQAIGQPQPVVAIIGNGITLPCHVKAATDVVNEMLEWSRPDLNPRFVHVRRSGDDHLHDQNPAYIGRTSVSSDGLKYGDVSLMLSHVKISDEGQYRCFVPNLNTECHLQLVAVSDSVVEIIKVSKGVLQCESAGWYPEPEVLWLDGEGKLLSAGPTETVRGPDDLYTVSSGVTVEKRHSNSFTCRVQQKDTNQTREMHIQVPDDFFVDSSHSSASTIIGLVVGMMFIFAVLFVVWKLRQNTIKSGKYSCG